MIHAKKDFQTSLRPTPRVAGIKAHPKVLVLRSQLANRIMNKQLLKQEAETYSGLKQISVHLCIPVKVLTDLLCDSE